MSLPESVDRSGWPEFLTDAEDETFVLLRDGSDIPGPTGNSCIYGLLDPSGYIDRESQWIPALGTSEADLVMVPCTWDSPEVLATAGVPPIVIPPEPIVFPDEGDPRRFYVPRPRP